MARDVQERRPFFGVAPITQRKAVMMSRGKRGKRAIIEGKGRLLDLYSGKKIKVDLVSWVKRQGNTLQLISFGSSTYHNNDRYKLEFIKPNNWQLVIEAAEEGDQGDYECQVSSHPPTDTHSLPLSLW
ncbi:hypothetical protein Pcinc_029186 [Petrolisthes cinctipes]|uniref:Ig-like domain-containing protein n=1 Tax=Petrolisthes cinctipes TaxID=88211 RepID=A0AAE1F0W6_PETCI|nr:hypothetical protein Pcinc_029186 [Petrolisthes cinctipes]